MSDIVKHEQIFHITHQLEQKRFDWIPLSSSTAKQYYSVYMGGTGLKLTCYVLP